MTTTDTKPKMLSVCSIDLKVKVAYARIETKPVAKDVVLVPAGGHPYVEFYAFPKSMYDQLVKAGAHGRPMRVTFRHCPCPPPNDPGSFLTVEGRDTKPIAIHICPCNVAKKWGARMG